MKIRVADYIANRIVEAKIRQGFCVVGGGSMHLNDAIGHKKGINMLYCHHEQACAIAAEGYARINNKPALCLVTSGPGGTNAITGVAGAYLDSIPMLVISGQVRYDNTKEFNGKDCRAVGDQEIDIISIVKSTVKYAKMITKVEDVAKILEEALDIMMDGRKGPVWIDIPVDIQGALIDDKIFAPKNSCQHKSKIETSKNINLEIVAKKIIDRISKSSQPVLYAGNGIRCASAHKEFLTLVKKLNIPVVVSWNGNDLIETDNKLFIGHPGGRGDRPGNLCVQNSDLIFSLGCRLSIRQVGYDPKTFAMRAYKIMCDIDKAELKKKTLKIDMPLQVDCKELINALLKELNKKKINKLFEGGSGITIKNKKLNWLDTCSYYKNNYKTVLPEYYNSKNKKINPYAFFDALSIALPKNSITVVGNGTPCVIGGQMYNIKEGCRFISNSGMAAMGYDLPASIGAYKATNKEIYLITGDGSLQMNIQELQTVKHNNMPIKLFYINNGGYHSIRQTQKSFFKNHCLVGIGVDSGVNNINDLSFPDIKKIANAYGIKYTNIKNNKELKPKLQTILKVKGPMIIELFVDETQEFLPKTTSKKLSNGKLVSCTLDNMAPFLDEEELKQITIK